MSQNTLSNLKVSKTELLAIVKENKQKHDEIFEAAEKGYWVEAAEFLKNYQKEQLAERKKNYLKAVRDLKKQVAKELRLVEQKKKDGYSYMRKPFPENHSDEYQGVIRRLELFVDDHLELNTTEFDCYVRNKWQWRQSFIATNSSYAMTGSYALNASYMPAMSASWSSGSAYINSRLDNF